VDPLHLPWSRSRDSALSFVDYTYIRVRWPGDGSLLVGFETVRLGDVNRKAIPLDIAATFLDPRRPLQPRTPANRLGFRLVTTPAQGSNATTSFWLGVPSYFPVICFLIASLVWFRMLGKHEARAAP
jgi:hypothetical protein